MGQRPDPYKGSAGGVAPVAEPALPFDLDWELQRLLGEEMAAMEPDPQRQPAADEPPPPTAAAAAPAAQAEPATPADPQVQANAAELAQTLSEEIDELYQLLTSGVGARRPAFEEVSDLLQRARAALLRAPAGVSEAEKLIRQAQGLLQAREDSRRWSSSYAIGILVYEFVAFLIFAAIIAFDAPLAVSVGALTRVASAISMQDILPFWNTMLWGGIGGAIGALYTLYWHVAEQQDFDRQFNMWYVVQPVMGGMLGAFIYLVVASGLLAMSSSVQAASTWLPSALACLGGFRQKFVFELLDKLMEVIGLRPLLQRAVKK